MITGDANTSICDGKELLCYSAAVRKHRQMRYVNDTYAADFRDRCNCLPSCVDISYETQIAELEYTQPNKDVHRQETKSFIIDLNVYDTNKCSF